MCRWVNVDGGWGSQRKYHCERILHGCYAAAYSPAQDIPADAQVWVFVRAQEISTGDSTSTVATVVETSAQTNVASDIDVDEKSSEYTEEMQAKMGTSLTYRHEDGINYHFVLPDLIVGSCLQGPEDVDKLAAAGVTTVFSLQVSPHCCNNDDFVFNAHVYLMLFACQAMTAATSQAPM